MGGRLAGGGLARPRCAPGEPARVAYRPLPHRDGLLRPHQSPPGEDRERAGVRRRRGALRGAGVRHPPRIRRAVPRGRWARHLGHPDRLRADPRVRLVPDRVPALGRRLAQLVEDAGCVISTGFVGTPIICDALVKAGRPDLAYRLLLQRECPSWLYPVTMGATTTWERWDSMLPDGSINPGEMTSFNHYALGAIADWLYRHVAGINAEAPGFRVARIAPRPGGGLGVRGCPPPNAVRPARGPMVDRGGWCHDRLHGACGDLGDPGSARDPAERVHAREPHDRAQRRRRTRDRLGW